jgi:hypothetical protein
MFSGLALDHTRQLSYVLSISLTTNHNLQKVFPYFINALRLDMTLPIGPATKPEFCLGAAWL